MRLFLLLIVLSSTAYGIGFGNIELFSGINQRLKAEVEVLSSDSFNLEQLQVNLAPIEEFSGLSIDRPIFLDNLKFEVVRGLGKTIILVTTNVPIKQPFLEFVLELTWPDGKLIKSFTVLLDPISMNVGKEQKLTLKEKISTAKKEETKKTVKIELKDRSTKQNVPPRVPQPRQAPPEEPSVQGITEISMTQPPGINNLPLSLQEVNNELNPNPPATNLPPEIGFSLSTLQNMSDDRLGRLTVQEAEAIPIADVLEMPNDLIQKMRPEVSSYIYQRIVEHAKSNAVNKQKQQVQTTPEPTVDDIFVEEMTSEPFALSMPTPEANQVQQEEQKMEAALENVIETMQDNSVKPEPFNLPKPTPQIEPQNLDSETEGKNYLLKIVFVLWILSIAVFIFLRKYSAKDIVKYTEDDIDEDLTNPSVRMSEAIIRNTNIDPYPQEPIPPLESKQEEEAEEEFEEIDLTATDLPDDFEDDIESLTVKLDLAKQYIDANDKESAVDILEDMIHVNNPEIQDKAKTLLDGLRENHE